MLHYFLKDWPAILISAAILAAAIGVALLVHYVAFEILKRIARQLDRHIIDASLVRHGRRPAKWLLPLFALLVAVPATHIPKPVRSPLEHVLGIALIGAVAWVAIAIMDVLVDFMETRYRTDVRDNLVARKIQTQVRVLRRVLYFIICTLTLAVMLLTVPQIRAVGTSLLASAGLVGLVLGMAAKSSLGNLIAGIQIALTQPIRIDDVVIVDGNWGWIEEIGTTYVVVRVWDLTRVVVPLTWFIENPFPNWTKTSANLLGYVYVYTDYTVPVDEVRAELRRLLQSTDKWLGQCCVLQVTDSTEHTVQLRALMDAPDSSTLWDLRCYVREGLIKFLQERYPQCLPKARAELQNVPARENAALRA